MKNKKMTSVFQIYVKNILLNPSLFLLLFLPLVFFSRYILEKHLIGQTEILNYSPFIYFLQGIGVGQLVNVILWFLPLFIFCLIIVSGTHLNNALFVLLKLDKKIDLIVGEFIFVFFLSFVMVLLEYVLIFLGTQKIPRTSDLLFFLLQFLGFCCLGGILLLFCHLFLERKIAIAILSILLLLNGFIHNNNILLFLPGSSSAFALKIFTGDFLPFVFIL